MLDFVGSEVPQVGLYLGLNRDFVKRWITLLRRQVAICQLDMGLCMGNKPGH